MSGKDQGIARVAGGYIANDKQWEAFDHQWQLALKLAGVTHFHATDFFNFQKEWKGWDQDLVKHAKFAKRFAAIAAKQTAGSWAFGVDLDAFHRILQPVLDKYPPSKSGRYSSLMLIGFNLLFEVGKAVRLPKGEQIAVLFEKEEGIGGIIDYYNFRKKRKREDWTNLYASIGTASKLQCLPLQAADYLAHECWRKACDMIKGIERPRRKSFGRLLNHERYVDVRMSSEADLRGDTPKIEAYLTSLG